jgi:hypothetical protein
MFDLKGYNVAQIIDALTNPLNRHTTRVEHCCSDDELYYHPDWLLKHYAENGGAEKWAKEHTDEFKDKGGDPKSPQ